jgi:hypothetical protein
MRAVPIKNPDMEMTEVTDMIIAKTQKKDVTMVMGITRKSSLLQLSKLE